MGGSKTQLLDYWNHRVEEERAISQASYEEAQSRLRLAMTGRDVTGADMRARIVALSLRQPQGLVCTAHGTRDIDVWYDCIFCLDEAEIWARRHGFTQCVSPDIKREGTDGGEWVQANAGRWIADEGCACGPPGVSCDAFPSVTPITE